MKRNSILRKLLKIVQVILYELQSIVECLIRNWPGRTGVILRRLYYKCLLKHVGRKVIIQTGVRFVGHRYISIGDRSIIGLDCTLFAGPVPENGSELVHVENREFNFPDGHIVIGRSVYLSKGCYILGNGGVQIGDYSCCSPGTRLISFTNHYKSVSNPSNRDIYMTHGCGAKHSCYIYGPIVIGSNVGIASDCIVLPGVTIHGDSFLKIRSIVRRGTIPSNSIAGGDPAKKLRARYIIAENK